MLSFLLVFFGIRSYRDNVGNGEISFGRAFTVGILITLISCICYVVTWLILYYNFMPDFAEKYGNYIMESARSSGASEAEIAKTAEQMKNMKGYLDNPFINAAFTFLEPFPVGLLITLISALILRKRHRTIPENTELASAP